MNFHNLFKLAMDRELPEFFLNKTKPPRVSLNLGAGNKIIPNTIPLDLPEWNADSHAIPYINESVDIIHAYHFLEHLKNPLMVLKECQRVLKVNGYMNICVPYYTSQMNAHDLDHKNNFCEDTWKILFSNPYYDKNKFEWRFEIGFNMICGIVERNLCLLTQLRKF